MRTYGKWTTVLAVLLCGGAAYGQGAATLPLEERSGTVTLKVDEYDSSRAQILAQARAEGGELLTAKTEVDPKGRKHGWMRLHLPTERLTRLLPQLHSDGKLYAETLVSVDNASEYEQLARRVESLQQHQKRLSGVLESPRKMRGSDILYLQERLFRANVDEGLLRQQRVDFERDALESTLTISLFEPGAEPTPPATRINLSQWFGASVHRAWDGLARQAARGATVAAFTLVYAPFWLPALLVSIFFLRRIWVRWDIFSRHFSQFAVKILQTLRTLWDARNQPISIPPQTPI